MEVLLGLARVNGCTGVALVITRSIVVNYMSGVHHLSAGKAAAVLMDSGTISWPRN